MADNQSQGNTNIFLSQADTMLKKQKYAPAVKYYEEYFKKTYKPGDEITKKLALTFLNYGIALVKKAQEEGKPNKYNEEDLETAVENILTARSTLMNLPENEQEEFNLIETYEYLGQISLMNNQFKKAAGEFREGLKIINKSDKYSWRIKTSLLFFLATSLENSERPSEAIIVIDQALQVLNEVQTTDELVINDINMFKNDISEKKNQLLEDIKEQELNKDELKHEEEDLEEEEIEEEEIEEEEDIVEQEEIDIKNDNNQKVPPTSPNLNNNKINNLPPPINKSSIK